MFCVMLIGSCDSYLLSGGWMVAMGPWGWIFELGKWTGKGNKSIKVTDQYIIQEKNRIMLGSGLNCG